MQLLLYLYPYPIQTAITPVWWQSDKSWCITVSLQAISPATKWNISHSNKLRINAVIIALRCFSFGLYLYWLQSFPHSLVSIS